MLIADSGTIPLSSARPSLMWSTSPGSLSRTPLSILTRKRRFAKSSLRSLLVVRSSLVLSLNLNSKVSLILKPDKVLKAIDKANKRGLSKAGAFVRRRARTQYLRRRKRTSKPGQGPSVHSRHPFATLRNIRFAVNNSNTSVVVGPLKFSRMSSRAKTVNNTVPGVLEHGGNVVYSRYSKRKKTVSRKVVRIQKRPFMKPAFKDELPKFASLWKGQVK